jgi:hypothetical protein
MILHEVHKSIDCFHPCLSPVFFLNPPGVSADVDEISVVIVDRSFIVNERQLKTLPLLEL